MEKNSSCKIFLFSLSGAQGHDCTMPLRITPPHPLRTLHLKGQFTQWVKSMGSGTRLLGWASSLCSLWAVRPRARRCTSLDHTFFLYSGSVSCQSCPTLCNLMGCNLPDSSVHGILQARKLERVAFPFSRDLPDPGIEPGLLHCRQILYHMSHQGSPLHL